MRTAIKSPLANSETEALGLTRKIGVIFFGDGLGKVDFN